jgi:hypothetical protein
LTIGFGTVTRKDGEQSLNEYAPIWRTERGTKSRASETHPFHTSHPPILETPSNMINKQSEVHFEKQPSETKVTKGGTMKEVRE